MRFPASTSVLIVGAGPVGLTLSVLLSEHGVRHLLVEAHPGTSHHPKARGVSARSMEIFRRCGLEADIRRAGLPASQIFFYRGRSLVDPDFVRTGLPDGPAQGAERTPSPGLICPQNALEALLLRRARQLAPDGVRFATRLLSFSQDGDGVHAVVEETNTGQRHAVRADWLVGCDGASSGVRSGAGIAMEGPTGLGHFLSIRFEAPLGDVVAERASASYFLTEPGRGGFLAVDNDRHWIYQHPFDPQRDDIADLMSDQLQLAQLVREAAGLPNLEVTVQDTMTWRMDAQLAETYRRSRVLIAGDAAHVIPPTGGHGMNTGIGDADNLAWKLAAVTAGTAGQALLDTYESERRPVARQVIDLSLANSRARTGYRIDDELLLTAAYRSTAVIADTGEPPRPPLDPEREHPGGGPGARLPHLRLPDAAPIASTLDLTDRGFTLLTHTGDTAWQRQVDTARAAGLPVALRSLADPATASAWDDGGWTTAFNLPATAAVLVRPDTHIAWQAPNPPADDTELLDALHRILSSQQPRRPRQPPGQYERADGTILEERSWLWQGHAGPQGWQAAWTRTRDLLAPVVGDDRFGMEGDPFRGKIADGAAGLATAFYLLADGCGPQVPHVRRAQVEELMRPGPGQSDGDVVQRWEELLQALGHDPDADNDPVSKRWRILRTDYGQEDDPTVIGEVLIRQGYGLLEGLATVLTIMRQPF
ncbi:FAD-dependent monooxygenase (plasmid) [Streptomyces viridifaciens]|uniref:FAD-dependent monooxygenase n=1 Tax=Kitasatospora aureofaciens TaxID=1894 RepID=UPI0009264687|nr:FAD-dependent monooxygenase [Streptomyces viridifaciens]